MEEILHIITKFKFFFYWFIAWWVINGLEVQSWNVKWDGGKFFLSCLILWFLTQFSFLLIEGEFIWAQDLENESRIVVLSIFIATTQYLFIPFILRKENREKFITTTLERFGYIKTTKDEDKN